MYVRKLKPWSLIERLPVWAYNHDTGELRLKWLPKAEVRHVLPQCDECGIWLLGVICHACTEHREHARDYAVGVVFERLTEWAWIDNGAGTV